MTSTTKRKPAKISDKKYQCFACKNIETHSTNHFGEIYCTCKKCGASSMQCIEPEAIAERANRSLIVTKLHKYRYDLKDTKQRKEYLALNVELKSKGYKLFDCISEAKSTYWNHLPPEIKIEIDFVFDNQWNSSVGRVHDWYESIYTTNKDYKEGYWLELTEEHAKARAPKKYKCKTYYKDELLGEDTILAINTSEASNQLFTKYWQMDMDIFSYRNYIVLDSVIDKIEWTKLSRDINGNPRYVCSWINFKTTTYKDAVKLANAIGGRKYHNKQYAGGIVFTSFNINEEERLIKEIAAKQPQTH